MTVGSDRRSSPRVSPESTPYTRAALLYPGHDVTLVNIGAGGALVRSTTRMNPGAPAELQLSGASRALVRGLIDRCAVISIDPLTYEAAVVFAAPFAIAAGSE